MIVDAAAKRGGECDLLVSVLFGFREGAEDGAGGAACRCVVGRGRLDAGVKDRVLVGGHALIPTLWLRVGVKEQQRARLSHQ